MNPLERRLESDRREIAEAYGGHPNVAVVPEGEGLSTVYRVQFSGVVTAWIDPWDGQPLVKEAPEFEISYPAGYPLVAPTASLLTRVFHPAVQSDAAGRGDLSLGMDWAPSCSVVDVIARAGRLLQFEDRVDGGAVIDAKAQQWVDENPDVFPLGNVDVGPVTRDIDGPATYLQGQSASGQPDPRSSDHPVSEGWWLASDGRYYPPELLAPS